MSSRTALHHIVIYILSTASEKPVSLGQGASAAVFDLPLCL